MTVWILHQDVDYEFGQVLGVFSSKEKAEEALKEYQKIDSHPEYFTIEEWGVQ